MATTLRPAVMKGGSPGLGCSGSSTIARLVELLEEAIGHAF
jgi:hypothetical protein